MRPAYVLLALSAVVYLVSLTCPEAFCVSGNCTNWPGYGVLLLGWTMLGQTLANDTWFANLLLFVGWALILLGRRLPAVLPSAGALGLAATFLLAQDVVTNEAGIKFAITGVRLGYWLWLASMAVALVAAMLCVRQQVTGVQSAPGPGRA